MPRLQGPDDFARNALHRSLPMATPPRRSRHRQKPPSSASASSEDGRFPRRYAARGTLPHHRFAGPRRHGRGLPAYDLILNQAVALKFLRRRRGEAALARFRNEVRIARQVSHPNVCRVYDIGLVEGLHFLSMEYLDGEDLESLLRRIGRLPQDKAIEFTRKICAGLRRRTTAACCIAT